MSSANRPPPIQPVRPAPAPADAWQATRAQTSVITQQLDDEADSPAGPTSDIGRQISASEHELFVSCAPAEAMQQQLAHLRPEFIAVHDIATASARKLLTGVAAAIGTAVQHLVIRRQGYGTPLCALAFIELATATGGSIRMYATPPESDPHSRQALAHLLLAYSRLGVVMVGDVAAHGISAAFEPMHQAMMAGPWPSRNLLLLPLSSASALAAHGVELTRGNGVSVRTTPHVKRPADAWAFITGTWGRLRDQAGDGANTMPALGDFSHAANSTPAPLVMPISLQPMPDVPVRPSATASATDLLTRYASQLGELAGMVSCCIFDVASRSTIAHVGRSPRPAALAEQGAAVLAALSSASRALELGQAAPDVSITLGAHHLLLRAVPKHPGLVVHAVLDKTQANLTLIRLQVQRMDALFD